MVVCLYVVLNPYYFSIALQDESNSSAMERLEASFQSANDVGLDIGMRMLLGTRNLGNRITGVKQMQDAVEQFRFYLGVRGLRKNDF